MGSSQLPTMNRRSWLWHSGQSSCGITSSFGSAHTQTCTCRRARRSASTDLGLLWLARRVRDEAAHADTRRHRSPSRDRARPRHPCQARGQIAEYRPPSAWHRCFACSFTPAANTDCSTPWPDSFRIHGETMTSASQFKQHAIELVPIYGSGSVRRCTRPSDGLQRGRVARVAVSWCDLQHR